MSRQDRKALVDALQAFEKAADEPDEFSSKAIAACMQWEIVLRKCEQHVQPRTLQHLKQRAKRAFDKAMGV